MTKDTESIVRKALMHLELQGWTVLEEVIPADRVGEICRHVEETVARHGTGENIQGLGSRKGLLAFDQSFAPYLADPRILGVAEALFGPITESPTPRPTSAIRETSGGSCTRTGPSISTTRDTFPPPIPMRSST